MKPTIKLRDSMFPSILPYHSQVLIYHLRILQNDTKSTLDDYKNPVDRKNFLTSHG